MSTDSGRPRRLRVATVGAGYFSRFHHDAWARMDDVELAAVCDRDPERACAFASEFGARSQFADVRDMLDAAQPDLLDIVTPPHAHPDCIAAALERGIPAICQKPFCGSLEAARQAARQAADSGTLLVVHENFRFQPWYGTIRQLLAAGSLGEVYQVHFRLRPGDGQGPRAYLDRQPYFQTMQRFLIHETAIHFIDVFRFLLGEVRAVYASLQRLNPAIAGEDRALVQFHFESGARGLFDGNRLVDHAAEDRRLTMGELWIEGSAAVVRLSGDGELYLRRRGANEERPLPREWEARGFAGDSVYRLQRHVVDCLRRGEPPVNRARDYLRNLQIEEAVYASDRTGRLVQV